MRLLLDTHAVLWWLLGDNALPSTAHAAIGNDDNSVWVSAASAMEITTKHRIGKLPDAALFVQDFEAVIAAQDFVELSISVRHARLAGNLRIAHKDPFDRFLIAQSIAEELILVSNEVMFDSFGVTRLWD